MSSKYAPLDLTSDAPVLDADVRRRIEANRIEALRKQAAKKAALINQPAITSHFTPVRTEIVLDHDDHDRSSNQSVSQSNSQNSGNQSINQSNVLSIHSLPSTNHSINQSSSNPWASSPATTRPSNQSINQLNSHSNHQSTAQPVRSSLDAFPSRSSDFEWKPKPSSLFNQSIDQLSNNQSNFFSPNYGNQSTSQPISRPSSQRNNHSANHRSEEELIFAMYDEQKNRPTNHSTRNQSTSRQPSQSTSHSSRQPAAPQHRFNSDLNPDPFDVNHSTHQSSNQSPEHSTQSVRQSSRHLPMAVFNSASYKAEEAADRKRRSEKTKNPLMQLKGKLRSNAGGKSAFNTRSSHLRPDDPNARPVNQSISQSTSPTNSHSSSNSFIPPVKPSVSRPVKPVSTKKTMLMVDPLLEAAQKEKDDKLKMTEKARENRQRLAPSLDDLHSAILAWSIKSINESVKQALQQHFQQVPLSFVDDVHYQSIFYPLLLEECRSSIVSAMEEREMDNQSFDQSPDHEILAIDGFTHINKFHTVECHRLSDPSASHSPNQSKSIFTTDDLVLLWYRPQSKKKSPSTNPSIEEWKQAPLVTIARIERLHGPSTTGATSTIQSINHSINQSINQSASQRGIRYKLQVIISQSEPNMKKYLLTKDAEWGAFPIIGLVTLHREYSALQSINKLPLYQYLMNPAEYVKQSINHSISDEIALKTLRKYDQKLINSYNESQQKAIAHALTNQSTNQSISQSASQSASQMNQSITLIQGPPGTGKTRTIVGLINLVLIDRKPIQMQQSINPSVSQSGIIALTPAQKKINQSVNQSISRPGGKILVCAPSNAAIDEIVQRLLINQSFTKTIIDSDGKPMKVSIVRLGAGKRQSQSINQLTNQPINPFSVESVSLDTLVTARMPKQSTNQSVKQSGDSSDDDEASDKSTSQSINQPVKDVSYYQSKVIDVSAELNQLQDRQVELEDEKAKLEDQLMADQSIDQSTSQSIKDQLNLVRDEIQSVAQRKRVQTAEKRHLITAKDKARETKQSINQSINHQRELIQLSILNEANIICATLSGSGLPILKKFAESSVNKSTNQCLFDCLIIDESAQSIELQSLIPLKYLSKTVILVGDDQQLSATVLSNQSVKYSYNQSMFERLKLNGVPIRLIDCQYRMHPEIRKFPSDCFYAGKLVDGQSLLESEVVFRNPALNKPIPSINQSIDQSNNQPINQSINPNDYFIDIRLGPYVVYDVIDGQETKRNQSIINETESMIAVEVFNLIRSACLRKEFNQSVSQSKNRSVINQFHVDFLSRVGIVTPYKQQVFAIKRAFESMMKSDPVYNNQSINQSISQLINHLEISTVDSFQGREKDFIIFSCVRAQNQSASRSVNQSIGFVADANRLNVALTRAKFGLFLIGSMKTLSINQSWRSLYKDAKSRQRVVSINQSNFRSLLREPLHTGKWRQSINWSLWMPSLSIDPSINPSINQSADMELEEGEIEDDQSDDQSMDQSTDQSVEQKHDINQSINRSKRHLSSDEDMPQADEQPTKKRPRIEHSDNQSINQSTNDRRKDDRSTGERRKDDRSSSRSNYQSTNQSTSQSTSRSDHRSDHRSDRSDRSDDRSSNRYSDRSSRDHSTYQSSDRQSSSQSSSQSTSQSINQSSRHSSRSEADRRQSSDHSTKSSRTSDRYENQPVRPSSSRSNQAIESKDDRHSTSSAINKSVNQSSTNQSIDQFDKEDVPRSPALSMIGRRTSNPRLTSPHLASTAPRSINQSISQSVSQINNPSVDLNAASSRPVQPVSQSRQTSSQSTRPPVGQSNNQPLSQSSTNQSSTKPPSSSTSSSSSSTRRIPRKVADPSPFTSASASPSNAKPDLKNMDLQSIMASSVARPKPTYHNPHNR